VWVCCLQEFCGNAASEFDGDGGARRSGDEERTLFSNCGGRIEESWEGVVLLFAAIVDVVIASR